MSDRQEQFEEQSPPRLVERLQAAYGRNVSVPASIDRAILSAGRARIMGIRARSNWRIAAKWGIGVAAAAMVAVAVRVGVVQQQERHAAPVVQSFASAPRQEHRQTMLDAYLLARRVKLGEKLTQEWDLNRDGVVDERDAKAIAAVAVKLEGGPVQ